MMAPVLTPGSRTVKGIANSLIKITKAPGKFVKGTKMFVSRKVAWLTLSENLKSKSKCHDRVDDIFKQGISQELKDTFKCIMTTKDTPDTQEIHLDNLKTNFSIELKKNSRISKLSKNKFKLVLEQHFAVFLNRLESENNRLEFSKMINDNIEIIFEKPGGVELKKSLQALDGARNCPSTYELLYSPLKKQFSEAFQNAIGIKKLSKKKAAELEKAHFTAFLVSSEYGFSEPTELALATKNTRNDKGPIPLAEHVHNPSNIESKIPLAVAVPH